MINNLIEIGILTLSIVLAGHVVYYMLYPVKKKDKTFYVEIESDGDVSYKKGTLIIGKEKIPVDSSYTHIVVKTKSCKINFKA